MTGNRDVGVSTAGASFGDRHQPVGIFEGERIKKNGARQGEDRGIGADPDGKRHNRDEREDRRPEEPTDGVPKIVEHGAMLANRLPSSTIAATD